MRWIQQMETIHNENTNEGRRIDLFVLPELAPLGYSEHSFANYLPTVPSQQQKNQDMLCEIDGLLSDAARRMETFICYGTVGRVTKETTTNETDPSCTKEGVRFSVSGTIGTGNILTRANAAAEKDEDKVIIDMEEPVELNFALRYLNFFTKATPLSPTVVLYMSPELPVLVEYPIGDSGALKFFLAPKIDDDDEQQ